MFAGPTRGAARRFRRTGAAHCASDPVGNFDWGTVPGAATVTEGMPEAPKWTKNSPAAGAYENVRGYWQGAVTDRFEPQLDELGVLPPKAYRQDFNSWWEHLGGAL